MFFSPSTFVDFFSAVEESISRSFSLYFMINVIVAFVNRVLNLSNECCVLKI